MFHLFITVLFNILVLTEHVVLTSVDKRQWMFSLVNNYDNRIAPSEETVTSNVSMKINELSLFTDDQHSYMHIRSYLTLIWEDQRLDGSSKLSIDDLPILTLPYSTGSKSLWTPDFHIINAATFELTKTVEDNGFFRLHPNGTIVQTIEIKFTTNCNFNWAKFPFDMQSCPVYIGSLLHSNDVLSFVWDEIKSVKISSDVSLGEYSVVGVEWDGEEGGFTEEESSGLQVSFKFKRSSSQYLLLYFFPGTVLVLVSWIALWMPKNKVTPRIIIGVSTLLGTLALFYLSKAASKAKSYLTSCDVYLLLCVFCVFLSMVVSMCQCLCSRSSEETTDKRGKQGDNSHSLEENRNGVNCDSSQEQVKKKEIGICDVMTSILIPVFSAVSLLVYFIMSS